MKTAHIDLGTGSIDVFDGGNLVYSEKDIEEMTIEQPESIVINVSYPENYDGLLTGEEDLIVR